MKQLEIQLFFCAENRSTCTKYYISIYMAIYSGYIKIHTPLMAEVETGRT